MLLPTVICKSVRFVATGVLLSCTFLLSGNSQSQQTDSDFSEFDDIPFSTRQLCFGMSGITERTSQGTCPELGGRCPRFTRRAVCAG